MLLPCQQCLAQGFGHTDVLFEYGADKIEINAGTFTSFFPTRGISRQFQTLPGFASETDAGQGILANDEIVYNVLSGLQYWVDGALRPEQIQATQLRVRNRPSAIPDTIVSGQSAEQLGSLDPARNRVGRASTSGDFHSDLQWFLESVDDQVQPPQGTYAIQLSLSNNRAVFADSDPFFFIWHYGAEANDFGQAVAYFDASLSQPTTLGDFDGNGELNANDAESLVDAIRDGSTDLLFDLNGDAAVGVSDLEEWVTRIANTWHGDVDVDGEFASTDLVSVFQAGRYESQAEANWRQGDWDADGLFGSRDLIIAFQDGGYEKGRRPTMVRSVPEPAGFSVVVFAMMVLSANLRRRRSRR